MTPLVSRRRFLASAGILALAPKWRFAVAARRPKLNLGIIGVAGRGGDNLAELTSETIAALCDVDETSLTDAARAHGGAKRFRDWREMLAMPGLDAVVISTPDHVHAPAAARAMKAGLDVYCEKPLTHTVAEARLLARLAAEHGRVTQMGTQIHAGGNYRRVVEAVRAGVLGPIRECHVFCNGKTWSGGERPEDRPEPPKSLDWDLWLGPAAERPYHATYHPAGWRRWWEFGGGTLGDMGCHYLDLAFWALDLGRPTTVRAEGPAVHAETAPAGLAVHLTFPAKGERAAVRLSWYDGGMRPPVLEGAGLSKWQNGVFFVGEKGWLIADYNERHFGPETFAKTVKAPEPTLAASIGHHREWIEACKSRGPTTCAFAYSGNLTEAVLLGNVAYRSGATLQWDGDKLEVRDAPAAQALIAKSYRAGFAP